MQNGRRRMGLAVLGVVVAAGVVTFAPLPLDRGIASAQEKRTGFGEFNVDKLHTSVLFGIKHLNVAYFYGRFNDIDGTFYLNADNLERSFVTMTINTESVDTGSKNRDDHLRSGDFFNTKVFPKATFNSTKITKKGDAFLMTGAMTINGKTQELTVPLELTGQGMGMGKMRAGIHTEFTISRSAFGITWRPEALGDDVRMIISVEGTQAE